MPLDQHDSIPPAPVVASSEEDRTVAIVAYLTLIGFIVAVVLHQTGKKTAVGAYHLRQALGLVIVGIAVSIVGGVLIFIPILGWLLWMGIWLGLLYLAVMGLIAAVNGQQKPVPLLGEKFAELFKQAFTA